MFGIERLPVKHLAAAVTLALLAHCLIEYVHLKSYVNAVVQDWSDPRASAIDLAEEIYATVRRRPDPYFIHPSLSPLGASPMAVLRCGGCCSGIARLYILALATKGVRASQVTLYHCSGRAVHCLAEVRLPSATVMVDPYYGFYLCAENQGALSLEQLQHGSLPRFFDFRGNETDGYPQDDYFDFDYRQTKTANWTKSWVRLTAYRVLHHLTAGGVDRMRLHPVLEWPQLLVAFPFVLLLVCPGRPRSQRKIRARLDRMASWDFRP